MAVDRACCGVRSVLSGQCLSLFYRCKTAKYLANSNPAGLSTLLVLKEVQELKKTDLLRDIRWTCDLSFFSETRFYKTLFLPVFTCLAGLRFES